MRPVALTDHIVSHFKCGLFLICADLQFGSLHTVQHCTFAGSILWACHDWVLCPYWTHLLTSEYLHAHTHQGSPFICGSCPLHTVWKKSSINTSLPSRGLTQSPTTFCSSYFVVSSGVKPLCLRLLSPVSLQCAAGLMTHSPAGPLLRYGYCFSGFTASANASGLLKYG